MSSDLKRGLRVSATDQNESQDENTFRNSTILHTESQLRTICANPSMPSLCLDNISRSNASDTVNGKHNREIVKGLADFAFSASHANGSALNTHGLNTVQLNRFV